MKLTNHSAPMALGDLLRDSRVKRGLSRVDLAKASGISASTITKYETEGQTPAADKLALLCLHLRLDPRMALLFSLAGSSGDHAATRHEFERFIDELHAGPPALGALEKRLRDQEAESRELRAAMADLTIELHHTIYGDKSTVEDAGRFMYERGAALRERLLTANAPRSPSKENGPVQKEPSRSIPAKSPKEAAPTASQSKPRPRKAKETG